MKILVVEDEPKLNKNIVGELRDRGFAVDFAFDGEEAESLSRMNRYDVIILDIMLPKRDGITVCTNLRKRNIHTPIIFLTARDTTEDKIVGLDSGGDDYIVKPFSFDELFARIRTVLRRSPQATSDVFELDELRLDTRTQNVSINKKRINLTLREFGLLEYFLRNKGAVVTREELLEHVWDQFHDPFTNVVNVHIKNLRKKLPDAYAKRIETVWGKGYRLV
jgi:DNA-binding response OmpR family regulator